MEAFNLTDFSSDVVEFPSTLQNKTSKNLVNSCIGTDPLPPSIDNFVQTNEKRNIGTQTSENYAKLESTDDKKLAIWLQKIYPFVAAELNEGVTQIIDDDFNSGFDKDIIIRPYQKISIDSSSNLNNNQGLAIWLSVHTNNAPLLVVAASASHDDWCDHVNQNIKMFVPKRVQSQDFIIYTLLETVPIKACIRCLSTNPFNRNIFGAGTQAGDLYLWKFDNDENNGKIKEIFCETIQDCVIAIDWFSENQLITGFSNGTITVWKIGQQLLRDNDYHILKNNNEEIKLTTILAISSTDFIVGTETGSIYLCSILKTSRTNELITIQLKNHQFAVTNILKTKYGNMATIFSCDLSGEVYLHDIQHPEDGPFVILKIPLPFKSAMTCSKCGEYIFCPGPDGSLDIYKIKQGTHTNIKGGLQGKGNVIKMSENGLWIIIGVYGEDEFQLYRVN